MDTKEITNSLTSAGLSEIEAEVYANLLMWGTSKANDIAKKTKRHRSNIYDTIRILVQRGLVSETSDEGTNFYTATNPNVIITNLDKIKSDLKNDIKKIYDSQQKFASHPVVSTTYGDARMRERFAKMLEIGEEILLWDISLDIAKILGEEHAKAMGEIRINKKIPVRALFTNYPEGIGNNEKRELVELRYASKKRSKSQNETCLIICGNHVYFMLFDNSLTNIEIKSPEVAKWHRAIFESKWKKSKKI